MGSEMGIRMNHWECGE